MAVAGGLVRRKTPLRPAERRIRTAGLDCRGRKHRRRPCGFAAAVLYYRREGVAGEWNPLPSRWAFFKPGVGPVDFSSGDGAGPGGPGGHVRRGDGLRCGRSRHIRCVPGGHDQQRHFEPVCRLGHRRRRDYQPVFGGAEAGGGSEERRAAGVPVRRVRLGDHGCLFGPGASSAPALLRGDCRRCDASRSDLLPHYRPVLSLPGAV